MTDREYFDYLRTISLLGRLYRRFFVYPKIVHFSNGKALDIGCGVGGLLAYNPDIVGVDINKHCVEYCQSLGLKVSEMEADILPFEAHSFNTVILDNVLEHIAEPVPLVREITRILTPNGRMIVLVPGKKGYRRDKDHKRYYDFKGVSSFASENGFAVVAKRSLPLPWLTKIFSGFCYFVVLRKL